jgi:cytochrome P450
MLPYFGEMTRKTTLCGNFSFIPEGTQVNNHTYSLHRNRQCFSPSPDSFWPDRWMPEQDRQKPPSNEPFILNHAAFNPFSYGPANCVGKHLAMLKLRSDICFIIQKFDFEPAKGFKLESWEDGFLDYFVVKRPPLPVIVNVRR